MDERIIETIRFSFDHRNPRDSYMAVEACLFISLLLIGTTGALIFVYALMDCLAAMNGAICGLAVVVSTQSVTACMFPSMCARFLQNMAMLLGTYTVICVISIMGVVVPAFVIMVTISAWCSHQFMTATKAIVQQKKKSLVHSKWTYWLCISCTLLWGYTREPGLDAVPFFYTIDGLVMIVINIIAYTILWLVTL